MMAGIAAWASFHGRYRPEAPAIAFEGSVTSWKEFDRRAAELAAGLAAQGVKHGDRIGALLHNHPAFMETVLATARLGAVFVPLNTRLTAPELSYIVDHAGVGLVVTESAFADVLGRLEPAVPAERVFFRDAPPEGGRSYDDLFGHGLAPLNWEIARDDAFAICYTSGTTGLPKGAVLTHANASAVADSLITCDGLHPGDRAAVPAALPYTGSFFTIGMPFMKVGGSMLIDRRLDPEALLDGIVNRGITYLASVPVVFDSLSRCDGFETQDLSGLRTAKIGGSPVPLTLIETYLSRGIGLVGAYGLTEGSGFNLQLPARDAARKIGFAGLPVLGQQCRIADDDGTTLPVGEVGELLVTGEIVMREYLHNPEATAETIQDGWLRTGDLALVDEEGYFKVVDRKKDMLISGGLNVYPSEIERVLAGHADVDEVAVIGIPDERWGEVPMACVVSSSEQLDVDALMAFAREHLADYKRPKRIERVAEFPRGVSGKVLKRELRELVAPRPAGA